MRFIRITSLAVFVFIWLAALNKDVFKLATGVNFVHDGYQYGDLYRLSNLPQFKEPQTECIASKKSHVFNGGKVINLFLIGDSFTEPGRLSNTNFHADSYHRVRWDEVLELRLDTSATNILLIECVERHVREKFATPLTNIKEGPVTRIRTPDDPSFMQILDMAFNSKTKEERFEMLLLQNDLILSIKEWKASFNAFFFDRVRNEVTLVNKGSDIVYYMDTDTLQNNRDPKTGVAILKATSSFTPLADVEVNTIADNIMKSKTLAKKIGFDEVILSLIPNKVSVIMPGYGPYNNLIERVYADSSLKLPIIDVLPEFRKMGRSSYLHGDSHWTCEGQNVWLDKVNTTIRQLSQ